MIIHQVIHNTMMKAIFSILIILLGLNTFAKKSQLVISTFNYPPFLREDKSGFIDVMLKEISEQGPYSFEVLKLPPSRSLVEYKSKENYIYLGTRDNLGEDFFKKSFFIPLLEIQMRVLYLKKNKSRLSQDFHEIEKATVGIHRGAEGEINFFQEFGFDMAKYESVQQAFLLLQKERVDLVTYAPMPGQNLSSFIKDDLVEYHPNIPFTIYVGFFIKRSDPDAKELSKKFGKTVKDYLSSTQYKELVKHFYGKKVPEGISKYMDK